jgi:hypothetical protein
MTPFSIKTSLQYFQNFITLFLFYFIFRDLVGKFYHTSLIYVITTKTQNIDEAEYYIQ